MLELGLKSKKYHEDLSKVINNSDIDKVFVKGDEMFSHINNLINIKEETFYKTMKI